MSVSDVNPSTGRATPIEVPARPASNDHAAPGGFERAREAATEALQHLSREEAEILVEEMLAAYNGGTLTINKIVSFTPDPPKSAKSHLVESAWLTGTVVVGAILSGLILKRILLR